MPSETNADNADNQVHSTAPFSIADCVDLDALVRKGRPASFAPLEEKTLHFLQAKLNSYADLYKEQGKLWDKESPLDFRTSVQIKGHAEDTREKTINLLQCFGLDEDSDPKDLNLSLYSPGGLFEGDYINTDELIPVGGERLTRSLLALVRRCDRIVADENHLQSETRIASENLQLLLARLALLYAHVWGRGKTPTSVNVFDEGGAEHSLHASGSKED
ncbi:hypothetical protein LCM19_10555 [Qipengyuania flava]|nr:hypothetical protein [Qipengyuania flava]